MSTSSAGSQQEGAPGGHPYLLPPASMPAHHEQQAHVKAVRPAPQGRCHMPTTCMHHALKFCITKQAKGEGGRGAVPTTSACRACGSGTVAPQSLPKFCLVPASAPH